MTKIAVALTALVIASTGASRMNPPKRIVVDGAELEGYAIAVKYLESPPQGKIRFIVRNYRVAFEGNWSYLFVPKRTAHEKNLLDSDTSVGPRFRIKVDKGSRKVVSALSE